MNVIENSIEVYKNMAKSATQDSINYKKRIDKAIEYIEGRYNGEVLTHTFDKDNVGELLEILKGSDKE